MKTDTHYLGASIPFILSVFFLIFHTAYATSDEDRPLVAGGIAFEVPDGWVQTEPHSSMRLYQFEVPGSQDSDTGVMAVFYFGQGQGGAVDANIERWKNQFTPEEGSVEPRVEKKNVDDLRVTTVYLEGTYNGGMGFTGTKTDYAALAAIAEGRRGPVFFKMTGPQEIISKAKGEFDVLVQSFRHA